MDSHADSFTVMATGQIESAEIPGCSNAFCKFEIVHGDDWQLLDGTEEGLTQVARQGTGSGRELVWNFPLDATYKSTNAFGWPQMVVSVYGLDMFGRDVVKGYGSTHLPTCAGRHTCKIRLYRPKSASIMKEFIAWVTGMPAEFSDPKFPSFGDGREVVRVASSGFINLQINLLTKDMELFGYQVTKEATAKTGS
ncbi:hypothetical protein BSKO_09091 [Bryopsis sp. KO-2023]|nr:hypothetical protein BSKO_09091 [Bryopsis sp. KO-2023]